MRSIAIVISAILIIASGAYLLSNKNNQSEDIKVATGTSQNTDDQSGSPTITFEGSAFSPETLTVKAGDTVTVRNDSSRSIQFESDPHPAHTDNTELNASIIRAGESKSFVPTRTGTFGYHDHLNPNATGTLIVK